VEYCRALSALGEQAVCFRPRLLFRLGFVCFRGTDTGSSDQIGSRDFVRAFSCLLRRDLPRYSRLGGLMATGIAQVVEELWAAATRRRPPLAPLNPKSLQSAEACLGAGRVISATVALPFGLQLLSRYRYREQRPDRESGLRFGLSRVCFAATCLVTHDLAV